MLTPQQLHQKIQQTSFEDAIFEFKEKVLHKDLQSYDRTLQDNIKQLYATLDYNGSFSIAIAQTIIINPRNTEHSSMISDKVTKTALLLYLVEIFESYTDILTDILDYNNHKCITCATVLSNQWLKLPMGQKEFEAIRDLTIFLIETYISPLTTSKNFKILKTTKTANEKRINTLFITIPKS